MGKILLWAKSGAIRRGPWNDLRQARNRLKGRRIAFTWHGDYLTPCASSPTPLIGKMTTDSSQRSRRFPALWLLEPPRQKPPRSRPSLFMPWRNGSNTEKTCRASTTSFSPQRHNRLAIGQGRARAGSQTPRRLPLFPCPPRLA